MTAMKHLIIPCTLLVGLFVLPVHAEILSIPMTYEYSGGTSPRGINPWINIWLEDSDQVGTVAVRIDLKNLVDDEFVSDLHMNLRPEFDVTALSLAITNRNGDFLDPNVKLKTNSYKAGGGGYYDILLEFAANKADRFGAGESITFLISAPYALTARAFDAGAAENKRGDALADPAYIAAAHVQSIGIEGGSGWITSPGGAETVIPEPATMSLLGLGGVALLRRRR